MRDAMPGAPLDFFRQARQGPVDPVFNRCGEQFARDRKRRLRFQWRTTESGVSLEAFQAFANMCLEPVAHRVLADHETLADRLALPASKRKQACEHAATLRAVRGNL